jgi:hypothetical protein
MKAFVATTLTQGTRPGDFGYGIDGELVAVGVPCRKDAADPARGECGCGRSFAGLSSHRATTTATVKDIPLTPGEYTETMRDGLVNLGWPVEDASEVAEVLAEIAHSLPEETIVGRVGDEILVRWLPYVVDGEAPVRWA